MSTVNHNRVQVVFNPEHKLYLYGAIHIVDGSEQNQRWEKPFIVSKSSARGEEIFYGTVKRTLQRITSQLDRIKKFQADVQAKLEAHGIAPVDGQKGLLPDGDVTDQILDEQEDLIEDVLIGVSVHIRILSEIFPKKLRSHKVQVYDYDDNVVDLIELSDIANLLVHSRYLVIRDEFVVDLISDQKFMTQHPQTGLKINFLEYTQEVYEAVAGITVKDLVTVLWQWTAGLSSSSSVKDIMFLTQNLYTLGGFVVGTRIPIDAGPLKVILDRVADEHLKERFAKNPKSRKAKRFVESVVFSTPRFYLEPDLNQKANSHSDAGEWERRENGHGLREILQASAGSFGKYQTARGRWLRVRPGDTVVGDTHDIGSGHHGEDRLCSNRGGVRHIGGSTGCFRILEPVPGRHHRR